MTDKLRNFSGNPATTLIAVLLTALISLISTGSMSYAAFWRNSDTRDERVVADEKLSLRIDAISDRMTVAITKMQDTLTEFRIESRADGAALRADVVNLSALLKKHTSEEGN